MLLKAGDAKNNHWLFFKEFCLNQTRHKGLQQNNSLNLQSRHTRADISSLNK